MDIKILVAAHKEYRFPDDGVYLPIHVGKNGGEGFGIPGDDSGDNISAKNPNYCELTALYWAWKNLSCDYIGLCHYRRYFAHRPFSRSAERKRESVFKRCDYERLLRAYDVILPKKRMYFIETVRSQYEHAHFKRDLDAAERIVKGLYPDCADAFDAVMGRRSLHLYNMFVMGKARFDDYCEWLFPILSALEKRIDIASYDRTQARVFGFLGERLFNVWIEGQELKTIDVPIVFLENEHVIKKVCGFLCRKVLRSCE